MGPFEGKFYKENMILDKSYVSDYLPSLKSYVFLKGLKMWQKSYRS